MLYISVSSDAKSHILSDITPAPEGRVVTTVCGLTHPESDFGYSTEDDSNVCARCSGKVDLEPAVVVESEPEVEEVEETKPEPKRSAKN
jgi:hypothetical protein